jgi:glycerophosphoryl diester phosphodiesterase
MISKDLILNKISERNISLNQKRGSSQRKKISLKSSPVRGLSSGVYIVGHRGAPFYLPENTIGSFQKAIELGVDFIECDVHLSKDGKVVVVHDFTLDRTTNGKGFVKNFILKELKKLTIAGKYKIPTLEEVLKLGFPMVIELKNYPPPGLLGFLKKEIYPNLVSKVVKAIRASQLKEVIIASFDKRYLRELNDYPQFKKVLLSVTFPDLSKIQELDLFGLGIEYHFLNKRKIDEAHKNDLKILAWTIDKKEDIEKIAKLKVDAIASNDPKLAVAIIKNL